MYMAHFLPRNIMLQHWAESEFPYVKLQVPMTFAVYAHLQVSK